MMGCQVADGIEIGRLACKDMVFGNWFERLGGKGQIHGVGGFARKINREAGEDCVDGPDLAEPPTTMRAIATLNQLGQRFHVFAFDFSRRRQFLEFISHKVFNLASVNKVANIKRFERPKSKTNCCPRFKAT